MGGSSAVNIQHWRQHGDNIADCTPSELRSIELKSEAVKDLTEVEIASLCAAYVVRYDDRRVEAFSKLKERVLSVLKKNEIDGALMADRDVVSSSVLTNLVVNALKNDEQGEVSFGAEGKIKQFFNALN